MANADPEMQRVENATCIIKGQMKDGKGNLVNYKGTGFHYGNGWIMTVAHNFQDDIERNATTHSILSEERFQVQFYIGGVKYVFPRRQRMAFIHHLESGEDADIENKDIAMVKLGHQWEHGGRQQYPAWEEEEQQMLEAMGAGGFALCNMGPLNPKENETVYAVHYGGANDNKKSETSQILRVTPFPNQVPMLHLEKPKGVLEAGASGCPIMIKRREGEYHLAGLHFSGHDDDKDGEAEALSWNQGIRDYINKGVGIIARIGSYKACSKLVSQVKGSPELQDDARKRAQKSREDLKIDAERAHLTIYLCNSDHEVINQQ